MKAQHKISSKGVSERGSLRRIIMGKNKKAALRQIPVGRAEDKTSGGRPVRESPRQLNNVDNCQVETAAIPMGARTLDSAIAYTNAPPSDGVGNKLAAATSPGRTQNSGPTEVRGRFRERCPTVLAHQGARGSP